MLKKFKITKITILIAYIFMCAVYTSSFAQDDDLLKELKPGQPIIVDGDMVEYFEEDSKIVAEGNHAQLMDTSPIYKEIYDSQLGDGGVTQ